MVFALVSHLTLSVHQFVMYRGGGHPSVKNMVVLSGAQTQVPFGQLDGRRGQGWPRDGHTVLQQQNSENCCLPICELLMCNYLPVGEDFLQSLMAYPGLNRFVWQVKSFDTLILLASRNSKPLMVKQLVPD